ncbi:1-acyl-sn-glycerol-3-phosphate acyltransferase OS=Streptomyces microflavus OX=1919 GN=G3I39_18610 PE=4 SV=1 [Streptomyces microflavus]
MGTAPRPVHFLIKKEAFVGPLDPFLHGIGQIEVDRTTVDRTAIGHALGVLADGGALGIFPEGTRGEGRLRLTAGRTRVLRGTRRGADRPRRRSGNTGRRGRLIRGCPAAQPGRRRLR